MEYEECEWKIDPENRILEFKTTCGHRHHVIANEAMEEDPARFYRYCPFCGKKKTDKFIDY